MLAAQEPALKDVGPFKTVLSGNRESIAGLSMRDLEKIVLAAYGPAQGLPDTKIGPLTPALYAEARKKSWTIISMKNDWKKIFSFE